MRRLLPALALVLVLAGCTAPAPQPEPTASEIPVWVGWEPRGESDLVLASSDFESEGEFPESIELNLKCGGPNVRPELHWSGAPEGTESFVVTFSYEKVPENRYIAFDLPVTTKALPAGEEPPLRGLTSYNTTDFFGPCSLKGERFRLWFTVYALDTTLGLSDGAAFIDVREAGAGHVLAAAELGGYRTGPTE